MNRITIGPGDNGKEVTLSTADALVLKLPENPTTGVLWQADQLPGPLRLVRDTNEQIQGAGIGAASTRVLEVRCDTAGHFDLRLRRMQAWEGESSADADFSITLVVT